MKVRLVGIDTPETSKGKRKPGQPYSQRAKKFLANMILNKIVDIKGYGLGPYNRILGAVYIYGQSIEIELLKAGLAEVYKGKLPSGFDPRQNRALSSFNEKYPASGKLL
ncbi:thermonuclease family protein [Thermodesulfobacteriota bacterium]